jgi:uncharacterized protein YhdP
VKLRKRRTRSHIIADLSVNHFEKQALLCGYSVERTRHDYGVDISLYTYDAEGQIENESVRVQLKATDHLSLLQDNETIVLSVERSDLEYWLNERFPVILVMYDAQNDVAYWLYIQSYFQQRGQSELTLVGETTTVRISTSHVVDTEAMLQFARFKARIFAQSEGVNHVEG